MIKLSKKVVILQQMVNRAVKGELKAAQFLLPHMAIIDSKNEEKENSADNLSPNDQEIIANFLKAHSDDL